MVSLAGEQLQLQLTSPLDPGQSMRTAGGLHACIQQLLLRHAGRPDRRVSFGSD